MAEWIIEHEADPNRLNYIDRTALMSAAIGGDARIVKRRLRHGADRHKRDLQRQTAAMLAHRFNRKKVVALLD